MYGKLSITRFFWHSAIFCNIFCYQLRNIFFTQFGAVLRLMIDFTPCRIVLLVWLWYLNVVHLFTELEQGRWNDCPENHSTSLEVRLSLHLCKAERLPKWSQYGTMSSYRGAKKFLIYCDFLC